MLRFYNRLSASDVDSFDELVSAHPATLVIGTAPGELVRERARLRFGFEAEGVTLQARDPHGYSEGDMAWIVETPLFGFPDGSPIDIRLTTVLLKQEGKWKLVHGHFSVGVPDEEVAELQRRWSS
jgi:hypothetical protein